eukprot:8219714-Pyramimonas_sp.AAC.1
MASEARQRECPRGNWRHIVTSHTSAGAQQSHLFKYRQYRYGGVTAAAKPKTQQCDDCDDDTQLPAAVASDGLQGQIESLDKYIASASAASKDLAPGHEQPLAAS